MPCSVMKCQCGKRYVPQRIILTIMLLLVITLSYNHRVSFNLAINAMVKKPNTTRPQYCPADPTSNSTIHGDIKDWDTVTQALLKLSFYIGYVFMHVPGGIAADIIGGRITLLMATIISTICTFLTEISVILGDWWLLFINRFIMGSAQGVLYPGVSSLLGRWVPKKERSFLAALAFSGAHVGTIVGSIFTGLLIDYLHSWPIAFYFWGGLTVPWIVAAFFWLFSRPDSHPFITDEEKTYLVENIPTKKPKKIPWVPILKDVYIWGIVIGQLGHSWMFFTLNTDLPNFLKNVQGYDIKSNGLISAAPFMGMWVSSLIFGKIADILISRGMKVVTVRRGATFIGNCLASWVLTPTPWMGCNRGIVIFLTVFSMILKGAYYCGVRINHLDRSAHFPGILNAFVNGLGAISGIAAPYVVGAVAKDQTIEQWRIIFLINFAISTSFTIVNIIFTSGERAPWDLEFDEER